MRRLPLLAAILLAACGTKGPLVMPPPKSQLAAPPAQSVPADNSSNARGGAAQ